jgi:hypothetical protein
MARESFAVIGSGTTTFTANIIPSGERGNGDNTVRKERGGTNVTLINPEDLNSVPAFATSGTTVTTALTEIWGPHINPLPRQRTVVLLNDGPDDVQVHPGGLSVAPSGFTLRFTAGGTAGGTQESRIELPLLHNVSIFARAEVTSAQIRIIAY